MLVDFCLPTKNEALILENILAQLISYCDRSDFDFSWRIVVIINGSNDSSADIAQEFKQRFPDKVDFIEVAEPGRGRALKRYWSSSSADIFSYMDCDLAVSLDNLIDLIKPLANNEADLAIGSRLSAGAAIKRSLFREIVSQSYNLLSRLMLGHKLADLQCGFKAVRRETFLALKPYLADDYWFFDTELAILAMRSGFRLREVPVDWQENRYQRRPSTVKVFSDSLTFMKNLAAFRRRLRKIGAEAAGGYQKTSL